MFVSDCLQVNEKGHLTIGGCDTVELAHRFGTPLYAMDELKIRDSCRRYQESFERCYGGNGLPLYASKAFSCKEICRIMAQEGMGLDVVSGGELYTALEAGFPADRIHFHGNNKTMDELSYALRSHVGHFVVDNLTELRLLNQMADQYNQTAVVSLRIKPGIDAHTHEFIRTGQIDSKFGFALETGEAMRAVREALGSEHVELKGLHCHIGSQIFDKEPFVLAAEVMLDFRKQISDQTGFVIAELNLGGGFGIKYVEKDEPVPYEQYMEQVSQAVKERCDKYKMPVPFIFLEPGRSIVGEAGITLYQVGSVKHIPGIRTYVSIDGGMCDNPRYALYQSEYTALLANKAGQPADDLVTIAGRCCESGDLIQENTPLQPAQAGDILAVLSTGAYNYSMASHYNRLPKPAVILVRDGKPRVIVRRETYEDLTRNDV